MRKGVSAVFLLVFCAGIVAAGVSGPVGEAADRAGYDDAALAAHIADIAQIPPGVCAVLGCDDARLGAELARRHDFLVHVLDPDSAAVAAMRSETEIERIHGKEIVVEHGNLSKLPYVDNSIDLLISTHLTASALGDLSMPEILRVLRPGGKALLGSWKRDGSDAATAQQLGRWLQTADVTELQIKDDDFAVWALVTKPPLVGVDDWSHWEHGPDNNPVSTDAVIRAPYMTHWLGEPLYIAMPAITTAAGGRIFCAMGHIAHHVREEPWLNTIQARNGYNGAELWRRKLPDGYLVHRSAFIATDDTFYMIDTDGSGCLLLDPATGDEKDQIDIPNVRGEWKWMALKDGILFVLAGEQKDPPETTIVRSEFTHWSWGELSKGYYTKRVPWGFGTTILAYDLEGKKLLWTHQEGSPMDSRAMVIGGGKLFFYSPDSRIGCLDATSGTLLWASSDPKVNALIEEPGQGLTSTPGFRTTCFCLYTPEVLCYEAQTRMNVVAVSTKDGSYLWHRRKTTNNPNMLYLDGNLLVGIGREGSTQVLDPLTGETLEDLGFKKRSCARLTATPDSLFCRGWPEGLTRYDRASKKVLFNGAIRPSCNDGVIAANGLLYMGPWLCDCNLSLMGTITMCSAGDFVFEADATDADRLELGDGNIRRVASFDMSSKDWPTYRGNNARSASSRATVPDEVVKLWEFRPDSSNNPSAAVAAGGLVFLCGDDGTVRAIDAATGTLKWRFMTAGPIMQPPAIWNGRAYVGSGDGYIYALEAATGRLLWRFRAAPVDRRMMVYGSLCSTWPVNTGVLVEDGLAYAAAGIIDYDGTYVYALDAVSGRIKWQNNSSGHLDKELRKGVSAQGTLTIADGRLWMPGGNVISPASYDRETGEYVGDSPGNGSPRANRGEEIGVFMDNYVVLGGRLRYSATENVVNPGTFSVFRITPKRARPIMTVNQGKIPPAWDDDRMVYVDGRYTPPTCSEASKVDECLRKGNARRRPERQWIARGLRDRDTVALALARNSIIAVCEMPVPRALQSRWTVECLDPHDGSLEWTQELSSPAVPGGLLIDRDGRVIVVMENGNIACFGGAAALEAHINGITNMAERGPDGRRTAVRLLRAELRDVHSPRARELIIASLEQLGAQVDYGAAQSGCVTRWSLIGPVPWSDDSDIDAVFVNEPDVDVSRTHKVGDKTSTWREYVTESPNGTVDLARIYGPRENVAAYAYTEVALAEDRELTLKIGSNDGFKCWFNGKEIGRFDGGRAYAPDQDAFRVSAKEGVNKILLKITQMGAAWAFSARLTDAADKPIDLTRVR